MKTKLVAALVLLLSVTAGAQILKTVGISGVRLPTPDVEWLFDEGSGGQALNNQGPRLVTDNYFGIGNDPSNAQLAQTRWSVNNTITNRYSLAPDGTMTAFRAQGDSGDWIGKIWNANDFPHAGTHTMSVYVKSNTGVAQTMTMWGAFGHSQTASIPVTTSWTRVSTVITGDTVGETLYGIFIYGNAAYDISMWGAQMVPGSSATAYVNDFTLDWFLGPIGFSNPVPSTTPGWNAQGIHFTSVNQMASAIHEGKTFTNATVYAAAKVSIDPYTQNGIIDLFSTGCSYLLKLGHVTTGPAFLFQNDGNTTVQEIMKMDDGLWHVYTGKYDGSIAYIYVDGKLLEQTTIGSKSAAVVKLMELGRLDCAGYGFVGDLGITRLFNAVHTQATITAEVADIRTKMGLRSATIPTVTRWTAYAGDSITATSGVAANLGYQYKATTGLSPATMGVHIGLGGATVTSYSSTAAIDATLVAGGSNVLTVAFGTNDLLGVSGATFVASLKTFCLARRAAGWKIVVTTVLPKTGNGFGGTSFNTLRATANTGIRNDSSFYDALADIGDTGTTMGADAAAANLTYYQDGVHPTTAGHALLAPIVQAAIASII